ncbi:MAG TPA: energy transducer TonB [Lacunisphaera sp.]|nr:energy transducer TonB [Lacunisphaera sp.]
MKLSRGTAVALLVALAIATTVGGAEGGKADITLEDVIFDASYLKKLLGPKTLVTSVVESNRGRKKADTDLADGIKAIKSARLDQNSHMFALPDDASPPILKDSVPHTYPPSLKLEREGKKADFLMLISADGAVKCLYCYEYNDRLFALAAAMAVTKWRYEPAKIQGVAVPVLARLPMRFDKADADVEGFRDLGRRKLEAGFPVPLPTAPATPPPPSR